MLVRATLVAAAAALFAAVAATPAAEAGVTEVDGWAYPQQAAVVRKDPSESSAAVSKLHFTTELGNAEVYRVSARVQSGEDPAWMRVDVLGRPNGRFGWVPETALGAQHPVHERLVIGRAAMRAVLYRNGRKVWSGPVGIGRAGTPTPAGRFYVREGTRIKQAGGAFGSFAFGTSAYSPGLTDWPGGGVIGIHGTDEPGLIPGRISHGCIRVRNAQISSLRRLMRVGTPVVIR